MKISLLEGTPQEIAVVGALGCMAQESSMALMGTSSPAKQEKVIAESFGRGHGSVGDQASFTFSIEGVSRLATLFLCQSTHTSHLQQSFRRAKAGECLIPTAIAENQKWADLIDEAFRLYHEMTEAGIPAEDARYILPLGAKTNIQTTVNARELCHYVNMAKSEHVPAEIKELVCRMVEETGAPAFFREGEANLDPVSFYPAPDLFASDNPVQPSLSDSPVTMLSYQETFPVKQEDVIGKINPAQMSLWKHNHYTFVTRMSLAAYHQAIRQRTWDHSVQTLASAAKEGSKLDSTGLMKTVVVPGSIQKSDFRAAFLNQHFFMLAAYDEAVSAGVPKADAFSLLPHSLVVHSVIHINGWNAIHAIGKRICTKAQWEIRNIASLMATRITRISGPMARIVGPPCILNDKCPEAKPCGRHTRAA